MKVDKKELILRAVEEIIQAKRFHEVRLDDVAKKAGIGKGTIYRYFKNKEEVFLELAISGFMSVQKKIELIIDLDIPFDEKLNLATNNFVDFLEEHRPMFRTMREIDSRATVLEPEQQERINSGKRKMRNTIAIIMEEGISKNKLTLNINATQYAELWIHTFIGFSHWDHQVPKIEKQEIIKLHLK